jgi:hypothetical protein
MIACVIRIGWSCLFLGVLFGVASCAFLARRGVPAGVSVTGSIAPDARLVTCNYVPFVLR